MSVHEQFYDVSPVKAIDQNKWDLKLAEVQMQFQAGGFYTPLLEWREHTDAQTVWETEMIEGDTDAEEIPMTANYVDAEMPVDSRMRKWNVARYAGKVQMHESENYFQQWRFSSENGGSKDWRPLLRNSLGRNVIRKHEMLSRNVWMRGPKTFWTFAGDATSFNTIDATDKFQIDIIDAWNLRLGYTGNPVIPGDAAAAKVAYIPPGVRYDFLKSLPAADKSETSLWRDVQIYGSQQQILRGEIGTYRGVRFVEVPTDRYGMNPAVLYNHGAINKQYAVTQPIRQGDGAPDPESFAVDDIWYVGQKNVTHWIQLEDFAQGDFVVGDIVTIHTVKTNAFGVTGGVNPLDTTKIERRVVDVDYTNNRLSFDRPIMKNFTAGIIGASVTGAVEGTYYAFVTKGRHVGFILTLGSRGGVQGRVYKPIKFYEPKPIDDFDSVWRMTWSEIVGYNVADPHAFECHFCAVTLPKPGGVQAP